MRLLNFSVGRVQTVQIGTEIVKTAHLKEPVEEPWVITENGAENDQRAVHPDKLYAFARSAYDYWGEYLGVDPEKWPDGFFGENLTLDDLDETAVRVGDVFTLGSEVKLVVSGARTPCVKLAWRLNQPRSFQKTFAQSRRTGVYLDVLTPGVVRPGDMLNRVSHDFEMPSVADVCDFIGGHSAPPLAPLLKLLDFEKLSPANRLLLGAKKEVAERALNAAENRWSGWRPFIISSIDEEAENIKSFTLKPEDGGALCQMRAGQHVNVRLTGEGGKKITRTWSLSSFGYEPDHYRITVLRQEGAGSRRLHNFNVGDVVELRAPSGAFTLDMGSFHPVVLIAAGIGVTPLMAMLDAHLQKKEPGYVRLIYGAKTPRDMAFRNVLEELKRKHPSFQATYAFSRAKEKGCLQGRVTPDLVKQSLGDLHVTLGGKRVDIPWFEADFYICGPDSFCADMKEALIQSGGNPSHIHTEEFAAPVTGETEIESANVLFRKSEKEAHWQASDNLSLLELAETVGVETASDCRAGVCLTCKVRVLAGETTADLGDGTALLCIGRPKTDALVVDA